MYKLVYITNDNNMILTQKNDLILFLNLNNEEFGISNYFLLLDNKIFNLSKNDITDNISQYKLNICDEIGFSLFYELINTYKVNVLFDNIIIDDRKNNIILTLLKHNKASITNYNFMINIINKLITTKIQISKTNDIYIYNRFLIIKNLKSFISLAYIIFEHEWLINETTFLIELYNRYKINNHIGLFVQESYWIALNQNKSILQLLLSNPFESIELFLKNIDDNIDLTNDNINSINYITDTYSLSDIDVILLIIKLSKYGLNCNVKVTVNNLLSNEFLGKGFLGNNFITQTQNYFYSRMGGIPIVKLFVFFIQEKENTSITSFKLFRKTKFVDLIRSIKYDDKKFNYLSVIKSLMNHLHFSYLERYKDFIKELMFPNYLGVNSSDLLFKKIITEINIINLFTHIEACKQNKGEYHKIFSNIYLINNIYSYLDSFCIFKKYFDKCLKN